MDNKKLLAKDWQLMIAHGLLQSLAYQRTIIENQSVIISKLLNIPIDDVVKNNNEIIRDNRKIVDDMTEKNIPDYPDLNEIKH